MVGWCCAHGVSEKKKQDVRPGRAQSSALFRREAHIGYDRRMVLAPCEWSILRISSIPRHSDCCEGICKSRRDQISGWVRDLGFDDS